MYDIKTIFTSFDKNTAELYGKHILFTMICIFWKEFGLKPRYVALHVTVNGSVSKTLPPPPSPFIRDHIDSVDCTLGYKATAGRRSRMKGGGRCFKKLFR